MRFDFRCIHDLDNSKTDLQRRKTVPIFEGNRENSNPSSSKTADESPTHNQQSWRFDCLASR